VIINKKIIIIGGGPAGVASSILLSRNKLPVLLIEKYKIGGLIRFANLIENYPGMPDGINGEQFTFLLDKHLKNINTDIVYDNISSVTYKNRFSLQGVTNTYSCEFLIVATGSKPRKIKSNYSNFISYDFSKFINKRDEHIAIIGGGDIAFDFALTLSLNNRVNILIRNIPCCNDVLLERAKNNKNIFIYENFSICNIIKNNESYEIVSHEQNRIIANSIFGAIGRENNLPKLLFDKKQKELKDKFFIIGDAINNSNNRYIICAESQGFDAAIKITKQIKSGG